MEKMNASTLRLFNAVQVNEKRELYFSPRVTNAFLKRTIKNGYVLSPFIYPTDELLDTIEEYVGLSGEKANATFHKSWKVVEDSSLEELILQQIVHYITTYGFEALGIYREEFVYIPKEVLELPEIKEDIPLVIIKAMTPLEILDAILALGSKIALSKTTLADIMVIVQNNEYSSFFVEKIGNRELKSLLYEHYGIVPSEPTEYLRFLVKKLTGETLLIKNDYLIEKIKTSDGKVLDSYLKKAPSSLGTIFFRYKPLFLAMKSISKDKKFFNNLRKSANTLHIPLKEDYLNSVTSQITKKKLDYKTLQSFLGNANIYRKIRLAYALNFRLHAGSSIVYKIRNGSGWVTDFAWGNGSNEIAEDALFIVKSSIAEDIEKNVSGKLIYIPKQIHYALPATEKQFVGNLPSGTFATVEKDMIVGVHWFNTKRERVDLDLSLMDATGKYGWDGFYRNSGRDILFSGDITTAPRPYGATELFYMKNGQSEPKNVFVNYFNFDPNEIVECKFFLASEKMDSTRMGKSYMIDPSKIVAYANLSIAEHQTVLGLVVNNSLYFSKASIGNTFTMRNVEMAEKAREYELAKTVNPIELSDILSLAGAEVTNEKPEDDVEYINLSFETIDKTSILKLLQ